LSIFQIRIARSRFLLVISTILMQIAILNIFAILTIFFLSLGLKWFFFCLFLFVKDLIIGMLPFWVQLIVFVLRKSSSCFSPLFEIIKSRISLAFSCYHRTNWFLLCPSLFLGSQLNLPFFKIGTQILNVWMHPSH